MRLVPPKGRGAPTLVPWEGLNYTQAELASEIAKQAEYIHLTGSTIPQLTGEGAAAAPSYIVGLRLTLESLRRASALLDLLQLCQDEKKKLKEKQEEALDKRKDEFQKKYDADGKNKKRQKWEDYWNWIKKFYICEKVGGILGGGFPRWFELADTLVAGLPEEVQKEKRKKLDQLGAKIGGEWAKDNKARKIDSDQLKKWGETIQEARRKDAGDGKLLNEVLDSVAREVDERLK